MCFFHCLQPKLNVRNRLESCEQFILTFTGADDTSYHYSGFAEIWFVEVHFNWFTKIRFFRVNGNGNESEICFVSSEMQLRLPGLIQQSPGLLLGRAVQFQVQR